MKTTADVESSNAGQAKNSGIKLRKSELYRLDCREQFIYYFRRNQ